MRASGNVFPGACTLALLMSGFAAALEPALGPCIPPARDPAALSRDGIRAVVLDDSELDFALLEELKKLSVNTVVTGSRPNRMIAKHLDGAGLFYIAYISSEDAVRLETDPESLEEISLVARLDSFAGFHYLDESALEGYTTIAAQQTTYTTLKKLFPDKLVLYPLRLDLIGPDETYLDRYFDPRFTDLVTPYFYPVGATPLGTFRSDDDWEAILRALLVPVRERLLAGQGVLPVLQAFEDTGFAVEEEFPRRQMEIYERVWPRNRNAAAFAWGGGSEADLLVGMAHVQTLREGFRSLFTRLRGGKEERCRPVRPETVFRHTQQTLPGPSRGAQRRLRLAFTSFAAGDAP